MYDGGAGDTNDPLPGTTNSKIIPGRSANVTTPSTLVHVNTLLMQEVLAGEKWAGKLTAADWRTLSSLFWTHVNPYGRFELDMNSRLDLDLSIRVTVPGPCSPQGETAAAPA
ncbi:Tn3 family transposase [Streptomyces prasinus]|uniref:Tn3 family transposase n=1 Tax=Streptomyces prasinus TaxID=67345 RepID=UPI0038304A23